jgi:hypothetical protein
LLIELIETDDSAGVAESCILPRLVSCQSHLPPADPASQPDGEL